jgi:hypothetical protein
MSWIVYSHQRVEGSRCGNEQAQGNVEVLLRCQRVGSDIRSRILLIASELDQTLSYNTLYTEAVKCGEPPIPASQVFFFEEDS